MNSWEFYSRIEMFKHAQKDDELAHYGTKGQKWGVRHWQNEDGTFNQAGKERYFGTGKIKNGVSDYLKFKKTATDKPAEEFGDFPGVKGLKRAFNNLKKFEFGSTEQPAKNFGSWSENNDISDRANEIYKKYKPSEWRKVLYDSDLSIEDEIKLENELNKKLYKEDKNYANIVNNEDVKNALKEYIDVRNDVIKESNRIYSKEFMDNNPEAKDWDGDGTEYWYEFADKDIANKDKESYWKLRETVSSLSRKHGLWNHEMFDKVMSDLTEPVNDIEDDSSKAYDKLKEHIGIDFREPSQKFGSSKGESEDYKEWYNKFHEEEMKRFDNWNKVGKKVKLDGGDVRTIYDSNEDLYNENARQLILKNADKIHKMDKALSKGDMKTFNKIRDTFDDDYEKDLAESFIEDKGKLKIQQAEIKHLQNEFDSDKNIKGKIAVQDYYDGYDGSDFISIYPSDMLKDPKKLETFKQSANDLKDNYNKHNEIITDKLVDMYYNAFKNTYGYEDHPLTKSEFKNTFNNVSGTLYPNGILEAYVESNEYGDHGTSYYFDYDILNKTLSYIEAD